MLSIIRQRTPAIWDAWNTTKLRMFHPLKLTPAQERAIEAERAQLHHPLFLAEAPIPIAVMKRRARWGQHLLAWTFRQPKHAMANAFGVSGTSSLLNNHLRDFRDDSCVMVERLFGHPPLDDFFRADAHVVKQIPAPELSCNRSYHYTFLMHSLALPFDFIPKKEERSHSDLIAAVQGLNGEEAEALQKLRELGALRPAEVNTLYLLPSGTKNGILHGPGPVSKRQARGTPVIITEGRFDYHRLAL